MQKYTVLKAFHHDGRYVRQGAKLALTERAARYLLTSGLIELHQPKSKKEKVEKS